MRQVPRGLLPLLFASLVTVSLCAQGVPGQTEHYFPEMVVGGGATSEFVLFNPNPAALSVDVELRRADGSLLSSSTVAVPAGGTKSVTAGGTTGTLTVGWARLGADSPFEATEFFQIVLGDVELPRVGVPSSLPSQEVRVFCFAGSGVRTGVALANIGDETAQLKIRRFDELGKQVEVKSAPLEAGAQLARFLDESPFFPGLTQCRGSVEITSPQELAAVTLRSDDNQLASAPVMTPAELVAPGSVGTTQLADGAVTNVKLANGSVTGSKIAVGQVVKSLNGLTDQVTLQGGPGITVTPAGQMLTVAVATGGITNERLAPDAVTGSKIVNGSITDVDIADSAITQRELNISGTAASGKVLGTEGTQLHWQADSLTLPANLASDDRGVTLAVTHGPCCWGMQGEAAISAIAKRPAYGLVAIGMDPYPGIVGSAGSEAGVYGLSQSGEGVLGESYTGYGVKGASGDGDGLVGYATRANRSAIWAVNENAAGYAGYFEGRVHVQGDLSTSGTKPFKIDHPLDPENRYLMHAAVESSEVLDTYSGNVVLDGSGAAEVDLPDWFESLNTDFRYSLTAVGAPGPWLYVAEEVTGGRFRIAGGTPGGKVSWQITARRSDPGMQLRPFQTEVEKTGGERGTYLDPEAYGQPPEKGYDRFRQGIGAAGGSPHVDREFVLPTARTIQPE